MQNLTSKKVSPTAKAAPVPKTEKASAPRPKARPTTKVTTGSFPEAPPATKFATAAAIKPPPVYVEQKTREDEHAEAIKKLEVEIEGLKAIAAEIHQAMDQKLKMYVKLQFGAMSLLGIFNIFG